MAVNGLASVGNYVLAQDDAGAWETHYVFNAAGVVTHQLDWNYYSRQYAWDPNTSRVYFFRDGSSPNDLHYEVIDQATGQITSEGETPYHGSYGINTPIRVSGDGQFVLLGSGDLYSQNGLNWAGSLGGAVIDARWFANGSLAALTTSSNQTILRRLGATNLAILEQLSFAGQALRVVGSDAAMVVLVINNGTVQFHNYVPSNDSDNDGVQNTADAFPLDRAASVDTDKDGYPDAWNPGMSQADSTTGLTLDVYPQDSACWLLAHGNGVTCNYGATIPNYVPDQVVSNGDIVYLLSGANRRVYRWSMATGAYLNPYVIGINQGFTTIAPTKMVYSAVHQRLYLGYGTGAIRYIDVNAGTGAEVAFTNLATAVGSIGAVGNFVIAYDGSGAWGTHYVINSAGVITDQQEWNYNTPEFTWDPNYSRVYYFSHFSPPDLHFEEIDQLTGEITASGESPYHGTYQIQAPIRVSPDGERILLGSGDFYLQDGLTQVGSLGKQIRDAHWMSNALVDVDTTDRVEIRNPVSYAVLASYQYTGQPIRILFGTSEAYLVHVLNGTTAFLRLPFYDNDSDTLPRWWEQLYGLSDSNAGDATGDLDSDGVNNVTEYANHSNPTLSDTDSDGLTDLQEIVTYATDPSNPDSDGDGLNDHAEVITHGSDPWDTDSDDDGYTDFDEVLYGGDPNDPSGLPQALTNYSQTFEGTPDLAAWTTPQASHAPWALDPTVAHAGSVSLKAGAVGAYQNSTIRFRGVFAAGTLSFWARLDYQYYYDRLYVLVDGVQHLYIYPQSGSPWTNYTLTLPAGIHEIEWRFVSDSYGGQVTGAAWIDDVSFVSP